MTKSLILLSSIALCCSLSALEITRTYPNPSDGDFTLEYTLSAPSEVNVEIYTICGRLLSSESHSNTAGTHRIVLDTGLPRGSYLVRLSANGKKEVTKIAITKE